MKRGTDREAAQLAELCASYRDDAESIVGLAIISDDAQARRLLATFMLYPLPRWRRPRRAKPDDRRELWLWLWSGFDGGPLEPDFLDELAVAAGLSAQVACGRWPQLVAARVVFPDGTIAEHAKQLLGAHVARSVGGRKSK